MRRFQPKWAALFAMCSLACLGFSQDAKPQRDPAAIHAALVTPPSAIPAITWNEVRRDTLTVEYRSTFPSAFPTEHEENQTVPVWLFLPTGPTFHAPFPLVVTLHYLGASDIAAERSLAHQLNARGIAAISIALPYHMSRAPEGTRSGALAITPDPDALIDVELQSVIDVRRAIDQALLRPDIDPKNLGISGISLGSLIAELAYGVDDRIQHPAFLLGGVGLAQILWNSSLVYISRASLRHKGINEASLEKLLAPIEPGTFLKERLAAGKEEPGSAFVVGAKFDTVMPERATKDLVADLNQPKQLWLDTGHYGGIFVQRRALEEVSNFFEKADTGQTYTPPASIHAPTLRLLAQAATPTGFDIGVGIDIFRTRERYETFGCAALTPHGPEFFIAKSVGAGFAIGGGIGLKGPGIGVYWSAVL